jgi:hypothetical protein
MFQCAHDARLYWKFHHLSSNESTRFTCAAAVCTDENWEDSHDVLVNDFKARYLVIGKRLNPRLYHFLAGDPRVPETSIHRARPSS